MYHLLWKVHFCNYIKHSDAYLINKCLLKRNQQNSENANAFFSNNQKLPHTT